MLADIAEKAWQVPGSQRTRIGRTTVRNWIELYQTHGFEGLKPSPRIDAGGPPTIPQEVLDLLVALRAERPEASIDSLMRAIHLSGRVASTLRLSRSAVYRFFAAQSRPAATAASAEPDAVAFTYPQVNDLWTSDLMHGPRLLVPGRRDGGKTYLYAFLDDASRMVPFAAFYLSSRERRLFPGRFEAGAAASRCATKALL